MSGEGDTARVAVVGVGGIGVLHARLLGRVPGVEPVALVDPDPSVAALAAELGLPHLHHHRDLPGLGVDGAVVATPNRHHVDVGIDLARVGIHLLVEKPLADSVAEGLALCRAAEEAGVHLLVGQHRRHNALVERASRAVAEDLGRLVATEALVTMRKPDSYYGPAWRRAAGAGPLLVNLIHEVDLQRAVCGEIDAVQAASGRIGHGDDDRFAFDDTAAVLLHFSSGALGTMLITESTPSPWSWEASVSEGMGFHNAGQDNARFLGTEGSLSFPSLTLWRYDRADGDPGWRSPLHARRLAIDTPGSVPNDPYADQLAHFGRVIAGREEPVVAGRDGLRSLAVVEAVVRAATDGGRVRIDDVLEGA